MPRTVKPPESMKKQTYSLATQLPTEMRAAVLHPPTQIVIERRPVPAPSRDAVLVAVSVVGVCGSDVHYFKHGRIGDFVVNDPLILGHEVAGQIVAIGEGVSRRRIGQRVALEPGVACHSCRECTKGRYNLCANMQFFGTPPVDGALCEFVVIPSRLAFPVPESLSDEASALLEPLSVAIAACRRAGVTAGSSLLIAGAGPIGLTTTQMALVMGATTVVIADVRPSRLRTALRFGATGGVSTIEDAGGGFDAFIDCSGAVEAIQAGIRSLRPAGCAVLVGMGESQVPVPVDVIQRNELTIEATFRYANTWPIATSVATRGDVDLDAMVTGRFDLEGSEDALRSSVGTEHLKSMIYPRRRGAPTAEDDGTRQIGTTNAH